MAESFVGEIRMVGFNFAPQGWATCDGQLMAIADNDALFALIGTTYGGDGQQTFGLPDLRGRAPVHQGQGAGLSNYTMGEFGGVEQVTILTGQLPAHAHGLTVNCVSGSGNANTPVGNVWAKNGGLQGILNSSLTNNATMRGDAVSLASAPASGGQPHDNIQPSLAVNFVISLFGIFPSRA